MKRWVQGLALFVLVVCAVGLGMLWYWDQAVHTPTPREAVLYLAALSWLLLAGVMQVRGTWRAVTVPPSVAAAEQADSEKAAPRAPTTREEAERRQSFAVLSAHHCLAAGQNAPAIKSVLKSGAVRPAPDSELRDGQGSPVFAARIKELDLQVLSTELQPFLVACREPDQEERTLQEGSLRAAAALRDPLRRVAQALALWPELAHDPEGAPAETTRPIRIRVLACMAPGAPLFDQHVMERWLIQSLAQRCGIPVEHFLMEPGFKRDDGVAGLWRAADRLLLALHREGRRDLLILVAAGSDVHEASAQQWSQQGRLFHPQKQAKGLMLGEGACVLALGPADWPADPETQRPLAQLHRVAIGVRDKSVEANGCVGSACLEATAIQALGAAGLEAASVQFLVSDSDQHSPRNGELFGAVLAQLPHLDANEDMQLLGAACGHLDAAGSLAAVALAAHAVAQDDEAAPERALVMSVAHTHERLAVVVRRGMAAPAAV
jgi:hypothetical protein